MSKDIDEKESKQYNHIKTLKYSAPGCVNASTLLFLIEEGECLFPCLSLMPTGRYRANSVSQDEWQDADAFPIFPSQQEKAHDTRRADASEHFRAKIKTKILRNKGKKNITRCNRIVRNFCTG